MKDISELLNKLNVSYKNIEFYYSALTHHSYVNESKVKTDDYERLEFLGDKVIDLVISDILFNKFNELDEGNMTLLRSYLVHESSLAKLARKLNLNDYVLLGAGEEKSGARERDSLLCDIFESFIAAIHLDLGILYASKYLANIFLPMVNAITKNELESILNGVGNVLKDPKSLLQEYLQAGDKRAIKYPVVSQEGPAHAPVYIVNVTLDDIVFGTGEGKSKKEAEKNAAYDALRKMKKLGDNNGTI